MTKDVFDSLSVYIIPKPELHKKVITVNALGHKVIGYPVAIDNPKYLRNALIFNLCFVCDAWARTVQYETVVKKLSTYLITLESEIGFLSNETETEVKSKSKQKNYETEKSKFRLGDIMKQILEDLNKSGQCIIPINDSNTLHLRVVRVSQDPPQVDDHHVPLFTATRSNFVPAHWDLTTQQILPYIDGFNHTAKIAAEADVEISLVKACVQNMVYYGVVTLIPIFQYSNVYTVTPSIRTLAESKDLQDECIRYVAKKEQNLPHFHDVFRLYCALTPGTTVRDVCTRHNPLFAKIDERKLIQYGVMKSFIRRLHKYPILLSGEGPSSGPHQKPFRMYLDGLHSYDEICCKTGLNYQELDEKVEKDSGNIVICWNIDVANCTSIDDVNCTC